MVSSEKTDANGDRSSDRTRWPSPTRVANDPGVSGPRLRRVSGRECGPNAGTPQTRRQGGPWHVGMIVGGSFEIRKVVGRGGMGIVYMAYDRATDQPVAIKVPTGEFLHNREARECFSKEAETWSALIHPNIVHAFDVRDDQSTNYLPAIFMDYVQGVSLAEEIYNCRTLAIRRVMSIAIQICWAMEHAHNCCLADGRKGILHRDLKPSNVLIAVNDVALVTDFGLAEALPISDMRGNPAESRSPTARISRISNRIGFGTPTYMAPERREGCSYKQSDVYSFGVMLFEICCGVPPFADTPVAAIREWRRLGCPVEARSSEERVPKPLGDIILACLEKKVERRPADFGQIAGELADVFKVSEPIVYREHQPKPIQTEISRADRIAQAWLLMRTGDGCHLRGDYGEASRHFESARAVFVALGHYKGVGKCYARLGVLSARLGQYIESLKHCRKSLILCKSIQDIAGIAKCYMNWGVLCYRRSRWDKAMALYDKALAIYERSEDLSGQSKCCINMAAIANKQEIPDRAGELYLRSLDIKRKLNDRPGMARCYGGLGLVEKARGHLSAAMQWYRLDTKICRQIGDQGGLVRCFTNWGALAGERRHFRISERLYHRAIRLCEELGDDAGKANCYNNLGALFVERGEYGEALKWYRRGKALFDQLEDQVGAADTLCNIGSIRTRTGEHERACNLYGQALRVYQRIGNKVGESVSLVNMAFVLSKRGDYVRAGNLYREALSLYRRLNSPKGLARCHLGLGVASEHLGDVHTAIAEYEFAAKYFTLLEDRKGASNCFLNVAALASKRGDLAVAMEYNHRALALSRYADDACTRARCYMNIAALAAQNGSSSMASVYYNRALGIFEQNGDEGGIGACRDGLRALMRRPFPSEEHGLNSGRSGH